MNLVSAFFLRDIAIEKTYRFHLVMKALTILFQLAIFYFLSRLVSQPDYFSFVLIGLVFSRFFQFWLTVFTENIRQEQYWGTAEALYLSPRKPLRVLLSSASGKLVMLLVELGLYVAFGVFVFKAHFAGNSLPLIPLFLCNSLSFAGLGLAAGSFVMYFKRGDPVNWIIASSFDLLSGVYFPLAVFPDVLRDVAAVLPTTAALGLWREVILQGIFPSLSTIAVQCLWAVALMAVGVLSFRIAFKKTRMGGDLGSY